MSHVWCINKVTALFIKPRTWFEIWRLYWSLRRKCFCGLGRTSASLKVVKKFERFMSSWADQSLHITQSRGGACESPVMIGILMFSFTCSFVFVGFLSPFCCLVSFSLCKTLYGELCFWLIFVRARLCHWCRKMTHQSVMCYREGRKEVVFFFQIRYPEDYKEKLFLFCSQVPNDPRIPPSTGWYRSRGWGPLPCVTFQKTL